MGGSKDIPVGTLLNMGELRNIHMGNKYPLDLWLAALTSRDSMKRMKVLMMKPILKQYPFLFDT
jgi:hypothetical protein